MNTPSYKMYLAANKTDRFKLNFISRLNKRNIHFLKIEFELVQARSNRLLLISWITQIYPWNMNPRRVACSLQNVRNYFCSLFCFCVLVKKRYSWLIVRYNSVVFLHIMIKLISVFYLTNCWTFDRINHYKANSS